MRTSPLSHLLVLAVWAALSSCAVFVKNAGEVGDIFRGGSQTMTGPIEKRSVLVRDNLKRDRAEENDAVFSASSRKSIMHRIQKSSITEDLASRNDDDALAPTEKNLYTLCMELCREEHNAASFVHWDLFASVAAIRPLMAAAKTW
ncbi:hypothetical protein BDP81DRAFT_451717 [Colletotrichum phormii]|uniref:Uncharacterized protein n=1 Tax=Colletotrichum phormii TaxID=359342 RepID=A0AAJ0EDB2_9PEZI|nr:uncharacterized protein BDP81DRAFT_451717 [Colletotrichum phormii]KAK1634523.1 hypothetical protein BDP81DRAFT_451717 [Colletotrichum phormii]